jgi:hypothetical protein
MSDYHYEVLFGIASQHAEGQYRDAGVGACALMAPLRDIGFGAI